MLKFLFLTDTHYRDDKPKGRTDDIMQSQFEELGEILQICHKEDVNVVLHGGDFFNTKKPSHQLVAHILSWIKSLNTPVIGVIGNHDVTGYNLDSVNNSGLGVLFESGAVERLDNLVFEKDKVVIKAVHSSLNFDKDYMFGTEFDGYTKIIISHNYVIPADSMPWGFIHPKDIKTNADLVLCGHYHVPYDYTGDGVRWINPGAVSRWKITERDHTPQVLLITVDAGKLTVSYVKLKSAKSGSEIFDIETVAIQKQQERNIEAFANSLNEISFQGIDIEKIAKTAGIDQGIPSDVLEVALKKLREAKEVLK